MHSRVYFMWRLLGHGRSMGKFLEKPVIISAALLLLCVVNVSASGWAPDENILHFIFRSTKKSTLNEVNHLFSTYPTASNFEKLSTEVNGVSVETNLFVARQLTIR